MRLVPELAGRAGGSRCNSWPPQPCGRTIPDDVKMAVIDPVNQGKVTFWLIVAAAIGRVIDQGTATPKEPQE